MRLGEDETVSLGPVKAVYAASAHYIVYTDLNDHLWYANDSTLDGQGEQLNTLWNRVQGVRALPRHNALHAVETVNSSLATAIGSALEGDYTTAADAVEQAKATLLDASERKVKTWYMPATAIAGVLVSSVGLVLFLRMLEAPDSATGPMTRVLTASLAGGSLGALISALGGRSQRSAFDPFTTRGAAWIDGALRIVYGVVTAFVVTLAVEAQFVTSAALSNDTTKLSLLLVAIAGGFLERWAVDIIRRVRPTR